MRHSPAQRAELIMNRRHSARRAGAMPGQIEPPRPSHRRLASFVSGLTFFLQAVEFCRQLRLEGRGDHGGWRRAGIGKPVCTEEPATHMNRAIAIGAPAQPPSSQSSTALFRSRCSPKSRSDEPGAKGTGAGTDAVRRQKMPLGQPSTQNARSWPPSKFPAAPIERKGAAQRDHVTEDGRRDERGRDAHK